MAYPYAGEDERYRNLLGFIAVGLKRGEKCIAAVSEYTPDFLPIGLRARGIDPNGLRKGQLEIITAAGFARNTTAESVRTATHLLGGALESADKQDWAGVRVCTGFMHLYQHRQALSDLLTAEMEIDRTTHAHQVTMLCTLPEALMHPRVLDTALNAHQFITDGATIRRNDGYVEPAHFRSRLPETLDRLEQAGAFVPPCAQLYFHADTAVIRTGEEMDFFTSPRLEELANILICMNHRRLVVDLSKTSYLDASTIGVMVRVARALETKGGELTLYDPRDPVRKIFRIVNLDEYITIHRTLESAAEPRRISEAA